jgi:uncharacterized protein YqhQ
MNQEKINVGGQAVIEGVMMRSPDRVAVAVRRPDGKIILKSDPYISLTKRKKMWNLPIIRGAIILIESLILGVKALSFSGDIAAEVEPLETPTKKSNIWLILTMIFSLGIGLFIFFYIPLILTELLGAKTGFWFNLIDGIIRLAMFLGYLSLIVLWKEIRRVFQYHGAEHKTIFAFEDKKDLTIDNSKGYLPYHPRCGTSFIFMVLITSIIVFMFFGKPETIGERLLRLSMVPLIGGISYELIKLSDKTQNNPIVKLFIKPGLWLQKITAKEPDDSMLEVALVALQASLGKDFKENPNVILQPSNSKTI